MNLQPQRLPVAIIGGGLAGSLLAARLQARQQPVVLFHQPQPGTASTAAAGLANVVTGKGFRLTWQAEQLVTELKRFFEGPAGQSVQHHFHRVPIFRPFRTTEQANQWAANAAEDPLAHWVTYYGAPQWPDRVRNPLGGIAVRGTGWANIRALVTELHAAFREHPATDLRQETFVYTALHPEEKRYNGERFAAVVFADGTGALHNCWWPVAPVRPLKGELLELELPPNFVPPVPIAGGGYVLPLAGERVVVGSTYEKRFANARPTPAGREALLQTLHRLLHLPGGFAPTVKHHRAGLRPTSRDRRPLLGAHPCYPGLWFLNGLGTKGLLYAPWLTRLLADNLTGKPTPIPAAIALQRQAGKDGAPPWPEEA